MTKYYRLSLLNRIYFYKKRYFDKILIVPLCLHGSLIGCIVEILSLMINFGHMKPIRQHTTIALLTKTISMNINQAI